jgi:transposase
MKRQLSDDDVRFILKDDRNGRKIGPVKLAKKFNVSYQTIYDVWYRKTYRDVIPDKKDDFVIKTGKHKLNKEQVKEIITSDRLMSELARKFNVHSYTIAKIRHGVAYQQMVAEIKEEMKKDVQ